MRLERIVAVDDREEEIVAALSSLLQSGVDLVLTSGGLGPTHDDRTVACVARVAGVELVLDEPTLAQIDAIVAEFARARGVDAGRLRRAGTASRRPSRPAPRCCAPVGTAPGVIMPVGDQRIVVLPGPPVELSRMWPAAVASPLVAPLLAGGLPRRVLRIYGVPESTIADAFEDLGGDAGGTETTICASRAEIEVVIRHPEAAAAAADRLAAGIHERFGRAIFSEGPATLEAIVLDALRGQGRTLATAESCTAGLVAARLAGVPGASDVLLGGIVAYANEVKQAAARRAGGADRRARLRLARSCARDGRGSAPRHGRRRGSLGDRRRRPGRRHGRQAGRPGLPARVGRRRRSRPLERRFPGPRENVRDWSATAALHLVRTVAQES